MQNSSPDNDADTRDTAMTVSRQLRQILNSDGTSFIMEAHNALAARLAEQAGFSALWASGLTISATMGLRDANELTWNEVLNLVEPAADAVDIPVLMDADSGYGDFNIFGRFVEKAAARGVAGVCVEDKEFPKRNSFADTQHTLASIEDFTAKIRAAKDRQPNSDFCVIARTEALVAGAGLSEALDRAARYEEAGADALFVHSKQKTAFEIEAFVDQWQGSVPLVIAPTTYASTPTENFERLGISAIIWANHGLRAAITGMQSVYQNIYEQRSVASVDSTISSVDDILSLTETEKLLSSEKKYASIKR